MRKIFLVSLSALSFLCAKVHAEAYVGAKLDAAFSKSSPDLFKKGVGVSDKLKSLKDRGIGVLVGYVVPIPALSLFLELDLVHRNEESKREKADGNWKEQLSIKNNYELGFMPGVQFSLIPFIKGIAGLRLSVSHLKVESTNSPKVLNNIMLSNEKKKAYMLGIEPTAGIHVAMGTSFEARLAVSYMYTPSKTLFDKYKGHLLIAQNAGEVDVKLKKSGFRACAALIYKF